jgi:predicted esterase
MTEYSRVLAVLAVTAALACDSGRAGGFAPQVVGQSGAFGRTWVQYEHGCDPAWGYASNQTDRFWLSAPVKPVSAPPLCVVLHSAGGNGSETFQPISAPQHQRGAYGDGSFYVLSLDCAGTRKQDWWWGMEEIKRSPARYQGELTPVEARVLATIEWVADRFKIDRNRICLSGISMGGSGALGMGLNHGDVFAAVFVVVPAGIAHMKARLQQPLKSDPPVLVNVSSHLDPYAAGQEELMQVFASNRYPLVFAWEPFGHSAARIGECSPSVCDYPWLTIRKNEAYPVFTHATTDNRYPGINNRTAADQRGQINGYFRWRNLEDSPERLAMELRLVRKEELRHPCDIPGEAIADVTFRRVRHFTAVGGQEYRWRVVEGGQTLQAGAAMSDAAGMIHVPGIRITAGPRVLQVTAAGAVRRDALHNAPRAGDVVMFRGNSITKLTAPEADLIP